MAKNLIRIATRQSLLALWQAEYVAARLKELHPGLAVELVKMVSRGDKILDTPLAKIGGKGLFVKELEEGLLAGSADIAVHSMKDVPMEFPEGLHLAVICEREDPRDAFVSNKFTVLDELPQGAVVADATPSEVLADTALLESANLIHSHRHLHGGVAHKHPSPFLRHEHHEH